MNKQILFTVSIIFLISLFIACGHNPQQTTQWKTFKTEGFMIDYPSHWDLDSSGQFNVQVFSCISPKTGKPDETLSIGIIQIIDSADLKTAVDNFMGKWKMNLSKEKELTISNQPALYIEANKDDILFKNYFLKKGRILFYIFSAGSNSAFKNWGHDAEKTINSFRIINN